MQARIATFENRDVSMADELIGLVRSRVASGDAIPGADRHLLLLDPKNGAALGMTFFDTEDDLLAAGPAFEALDAEIPEAVRGRRIAFRSWEVALDELGDGLLAARTGSVDAPSWRVVELVYLVRDQIATEAAELDGWRGAVLLVDRASGETRTITFWESDDALRRSEVREAQLRIRVAAEIGASVTRVDRYAVAVDSVPTAV